MTIDKRTGFDKNGVKTYSEKTPGVEKARIGPVTKPPLPPPPPPSGGIKPK